MSTSISTSRQRASDIKLLAIITTGVLMVGFFVAGTILFLSRGGSPGPCGKVNAGALSTLVKTAAIAPSFVAFGGNCQYWLAMRDGKLVAIRPTIAARDCTVDWKPSTNKFSCGGREVSFAQLDYYPTSSGTGEFKGSWIVDFGGAPTTTTTTTG